MLQLPVFHFPISINGNFIVEAVVATRVSRIN